MDCVCRKIWGRIVIPVSRQPEPSNFDRNVRQPGQRYLAGNPSPKFKGRCKYWTNTTKELNAAYKQMCAYSSMHLATPGTVDHFIPKSRCPKLAYEWDNYRLASQRMNTHKGDSRDVIDPFVVQPGWFVMDFPSCIIKAGPGLPRLRVKQITKTIKALKLNDDDYLVQGRCNMMLHFAKGEITLSFLEQRYPFLASEIVRQGIETTAHTLFKQRTVSP
jgi:hypothetical protein